MGNKASMSSTTAATQVASDQPSSNRVPFVVKNFTVLTYNVWFDYFEFNSRMKYIIEKTLELQPDVCCFQEVLPAFAMMLREHAELNQRYAMSSVVSSGYGTMTLARREFSPRFDTVEFPTMMGRSLLKTVCEINGVDIAVGNVHLESMSSEKLRRKQLIICQKSLKKYTSSVLVGDFNFCSEQNFPTHNSASSPLENNVLQQVLPSYIDVWPFVHKADAEGNRDLGLTFDSDVNKMIQPTERMRYDRVMARCGSRGGGSGGADDSRVILPSDIVRVGVHSFQSATAAQVWPSDHFGLLTTFQIESPRQTQGENAWSGGEGKEHDDEDTPPIPPVCDTNRKRPVVTLSDIQGQQQTLSGTDTVVTRRDGSRFVERMDRATGEVTSQNVQSMSEACLQCGVSLGFQLEKTILCSDCLASKKSRQEVSVGPLLQSQLSARVAHILHSATQPERKHPVRLLAIDFDATLCQIHTYGRWQGSAEALAAHTRPVFRALLEAASLLAVPPAEERGGLRVGIVTFSGQKDLIREVLELVLGRQAASQIFLRTAHRDWSVPASYVPTSKITGKEPHIASIVEEIFQKSCEVIRAEQVLLIDDDVKNISCARDAQHKAVVFPSLPLPGIHMRCSAPQLEAAGVRVLHRCQLANGAMLCISQGSVVNFSAPGPSAIVNAANTGGLGGGGVDGAIGRAGGDRLLAARKAWPQDAQGVRIPTGECRATGPDSFGSLRVTYVLHTAGPNYQSIASPDACDDVEDSLKAGDALLAASYCNSMRCAKERSIELLGFSLISAGVYRGSQSLRAVLTIALDTIAQEAYEKLREVHLVAFAQDELDTLLWIVAQDPPASLQRGAGGEAAIQQFIDDLENTSVS